ncbi:uncharacterized protein LOC127363693 isoform X2 [Dicentrarchus labrax]|uniref:uncharacterized protein LOC127363693 isoform X2 n=1 Tax=Dicentrarchus labrax TaxID=13489 RepID=UPI0021F64F4D|nr:uncharacterized protein LOC127363693 isoform X2 [Dicentrarchus labrax]XP_051256459.1 uncharacterized protein LOC127363693 isoform X2 [Dicentrarchus labrax]
MMSRLSLLFAFLLYPVGFGEPVHVILGDPVSFPVIGNCLNEPVDRLYRVTEHSNRPVAAREDGVCKPAEDYKDRVDVNSCFAFSRSVYTDTGLYELTCGSRDQRVQLNVVVGSEASATEGQPVQLPCYFSPAGGHVDSIRWERNGHTVLERNLATGKTKYGTGFERRVSLPADGHKHGDWSLMWDQVRLEDGGDFFCSAHRGDVREGWGDPAAVRMKVTKRNPDQTTPHPPHTCSTAEKHLGTGAIVGVTAAVGLFVVDPVFSAGS